MNFFGHQQRARQQSRRLIVLFVCAVLAVVAAVDLVLLFVLGGSVSETGAWQPPLGPDALQRNAALLTIGALATAAVVLLASLYRTAKLRLGGGQVAREVGGVLVDADPGDPLRRRLRNVVEEIAIASGVPVPEIYVLEQEAGINAFAAGYTPADAAVAVTRGALERLSRSELQGVVAHEFSHILNGDMRLNIRLMGALFGILVLTVIGRRILLHTRHIGSSRDRGGAAILAIAFGVLLIGSVGQFFGRWIKAAVSRQREFLADASAVQFTRDTEGIGGALKKIAAYDRGSELRADTEEIGHMLFGAGHRMLMFATHPPIEQRIRRIDPSFRDEELEQLVQRLDAEERESRERAAELRSGDSAQAPHAGRGWPFPDAGTLIGEIGQPGFERLLLAGALAAALPPDLRRAAQSVEWAPQVLVYTLLDADRGLRERQLLVVAQRLGADFERGVRALLDGAGPPTDAQRLPLLELAFPALKRRPPEHARSLLAAVKELVVADGRLDLFEYLLARLIAQHLRESQNPRSARAAGRSGLRDLEAESLRLLAVLAAHGNREPKQAEAAFRGGCVELGFDSAMPQVADWPAALDADLPRLDRLRPADKERLVRGLMQTVMHDAAVVPAELELLRAVCDLVHVPVPLLAAGAGPGDRSGASGELG